MPSSASHIWKEVKCAHLKPAICSNANVATNTKGQPAPQILQSIVVFMGGGGAIIARSDKQTLSFGKGLSADEARWMHGVMKRILTS